jgi:peptide chain release factor 1
MNKADLKIEYMRGQGPGGQHRNKTNSACRITHIPTGLTAWCDERDQKTSLRKAMEDIQAKVAEAKAEEKARQRKDRRDEAIKPQATIRTYDFKRNIVKDHRTGKEASLKEVMRKGRLELLR